MFTRNKSFVTLIIIFTFLLHSHSASAIDLNHMVIKSKPIKDSKELVKTSDLIFLGRFEHVKHQVRTDHAVTGGQLYNFIQPISIKDMYKGSQQTSVDLLTTGVLPLPKPENPLNTLYPGPIAEGVYLVFIKKFPHQDLYYLNGGWQGLYPVISGRTIALKESGKPEFNHLKPTDIPKVIETIENAQ
ncbi:hypothetical protein EV207_10287 [Scopulibacillus darangshiensis]|uniref:Uncharacterized protein n=1 Tax=Scopulibacillus darangshiensis TaxID=442528 RepID=A0A4R2P9K6_9BACL|nr:hypothetical protein [Scopulibacillus darangshiensis]TCP31597.1 hypothetical protein EV207_10287 [Scopulibacillus darangshiensis]